ncbi:hypothetical protein SAMN02745216_03881 [Desulfatibacillum alkenivorans DSM 16219]|jgi:hypothetical protein|uniref:Ribbon-helix-helix protein, copG family n=1 Tax=Desulfatibacillum alkenivorans DSM 16219 TaxID=1121393 RepID=A0A1M6UEH9_9BACT|nr:hypothetical protein [Desulfatibacillum alkenivorans]SHK67571.1 hypothetical protein SAMN02745216_03881 [Desulfatibacillum alkenivorans DSM 16219]
MKQPKLVPLTLSVPEEIRSELRTMAAKKNLDHPDKVTSAAEIAREIILSYLKEQ